MLTHRLMLALAPFAIAGSIAAAATANGITAAPDGVACQISATPMPAGVELTTYASAQAPVSGSYHFVVSKSGSGGSSDIDQGGDFNARPGKQALLGVVDLNVDAGTHYFAKLTLAWNAHSTACSRRFGG